jgi:hypothetical protein
MAPVVRRDDIKIGSRWKIHRKRRWLLVEVVDITERPGKGGREGFIRRSYTLKVVGTNDKFTLEHFRQLQPVVEDPVDGEALLRRGFETLLAAAREIYDVRCCLCACTLPDHGHSPEPLISRGRCCDSCHQRRVLPRSLDNPGGDMDSDEESADEDTDVYPEGEQDASMTPEATPSVAAS